MLKLAAAVILVLAGAVIADSFHYEAATCPTFVYPTDTFTDFSSICKSNNGNGRSRGNSGKCKVDE